MLNKIKKYIHNLLHPAICEVWLLHSITTDFSSNPALRECEVSPETLEHKIQEALQQGKVFVSVAQIEQILAPNNKFSTINTILNTFYKKYVCVTLDDGYRNNLTTAFPIFTKYNIPFCIFVCSGFISGDYNPGIGKHKEMLSIYELQRIAQEPLCTIGVHSVSHAHLNELDRNKQEEELQISKQIIESWIGKKVNYCAYPYGGANKDTFSIMSGLGFNLGFSAWGGEIRWKEYFKWLLPRKIISEIQIVH